MKRYASVLGLKGDAIEDYKRLHRAVWPDVLQQIERSGIRNYSIFLKEPENLLFAYYEYSGNDHAADMSAMAANPVTQKWWAICDPMQEPLATRKAEEWWAGLEEVFHTD